MFNTTGFCLIVSGCPVVPPGVFIFSVYHHIMYRSKLTDAFVYVFATSHQNNDSITDMWLAFISNAHADATIGDVWKKVHKNITQ